eukprot:GEMP01058316.1.p1 GENE.GEMP01058316.1~~GEMP01058316.1.p1  ORF type:complete len:252 (+),score=42.47 GEMP01058316.1:83-838(+)
MVCHVDAGNSGLPEDISRMLVRSQDTMNDRPVYEGDDDISLYYWDEEGWPSGWWLGQMVGGDQVFAFSQSDAFDAPADGWRCPWHLEICRSFQIHHETETLELSARLIDPYTSWVALLQFCSGIAWKSMFADKEKFQGAFAQFLKFRELMLSGPFDTGALVAHAGLLFEEKDRIDSKILPAHAPEGLLDNARSVVHMDLLRILAFEAVHGNKLLSNELSVVAKVLAHFRFEKDFSKGVHLFINNLKSLKKK